MDINSFIKIKKILYVDHTATEYVRGIVCRKNVAHKRMKTSFEKPKILLILGGLDLIKEKEFTFKDLINKDEK